MIEPSIGAVLTGIFGALFLRLGYLQLKSGLAWTRIGFDICPITRDGTPLLYWFAVATSFFFGAVMLLVTASLLVG